MICTILLFFMFLFLVYMIYNLIEDNNKLERKFNLLCGVVDSVMDLTDKSDKVPVKDFIDELLEED